jgi:hypothetical protein
MPLRRAAACFNRGSCFHRFLLCTGGGPARIRDPRGLGASDLPRVCAALLPPGAVHARHGR